MSKNKRFEYFVDEDREDFIIDINDKFPEVDLCRPCGKQVTRMLNELKNEKK